MVRLIGVGLLLFLFALLVLGSRQTSLTTDEPSYTAVGYALLARGKEAFWILPQRGYPPLLPGMEALLFYLADPNIPLEQLAGWPTGYASFIQDFKPYLLPLERTKTVTRMPTILLTMTLGAVVFRWGKDLWGPRAGLLALLTLVFDPTLLAHGRLANSDAGATALGTAALYTTWRWAENPSWRWTLGTGALLGLTMLAKASGILWMAAAGLIVLGTIIWRRRESRDVLLLIHGIAAGGLSLLIVWAGYGFDWGMVRDFPFPVPAPTHWESLLYLDQYADVFFALGQWEYGGWWWYYPLAFLIKNPLPLLTGWAIGLVVLLQRSSSRSCFLALGLFPLLYASAAIYEGINVGYRYMLPIHPFLYLTIGGGLGQWGWGGQGRSWRRWLLMILGVWYVAATVCIFPYEIAYFNELVGGPEGGYRYLADSNVDWGQSTGVRDAYLQAHPDVRAEPPTSKFRPSPGSYLVGASYLQGVGIGDRYAYEWFRHWEPQTKLKYGLLVYDVPPFEMDWAAQCWIPAVPLDDASIATGMGRDDLRNVEFDCTRAWLYPGGGSAPGIYVLHHDLVDGSGLCLPSFLPCPPVPDDPFITRRLTQARLSFEQVHGGQLPAFVLYEMTSAPAELSLPSMAYVVPAEAVPAMLGAYVPLSNPVALDGPLTFLSTKTYIEGEVLEVETWWMVTDDPISRPFSIMAHLVSSDGETMGEADGLGVSPLTLAAGDVVVQRHRFSRPPEGAAVWLLAGAYWLDTMERWTVAGVPGADALLVRLEPVPARLSSTRPGYTSHRRSTSMRCSDWPEEAFGSTSVFSTARPLPHRPIFVADHRHTWTRAVGLSKTCAWNFKSRWPAPNVSPGRGSPRPCSLAQNPNLRHTRCNHSQKGT